jgi:hypothetical protein
MSTQQSTNKAIRLELYAAIIIDLSRGWSKYNDKPALAILHPQRGSRETGSPPALIVEVYRATDATPSGLVNALASLILDRARKAVAVGGADLG